MPKPRRKTDEQIANELARKALPPEQVKRGAFALVSVANHSEADQRDTVRSIGYASKEAAKQKSSTIRRKTHIERMIAQRQLTPAEGAICQWYADQHELGFATVGCTANYAGAGGGGFGSHDLLARYSEQAIARGNYTIARKALGGLTSLFERVVIHETPIAAPGERGRATRLRSTLSLAIRRLDEAIGHMVEIDA